MRAFRLVRSLLASVAVAALAATPAAWSEWQPQLLERWLTAVETHEPGRVDSAAHSVATLSETDLRQLWRDVQVLMLIVANPEQTRFRVPPMQYEPRRAQSGSRFGRSSRTAFDALISFTPTEREWLDRLADRLRQAGADLTRRRAMLLHTDAVLLASNLVAASAGPATMQMPMRLLVGDGRSAGGESVSPHWELARMFGKAMSAEPASQRFVRDWYRATVALAQRSESFDAANLTAGLEQFPRDPVLLLLAGCEREALASPLFQEFARTVRVSRMRISMDDADGELAAAERFYVRALAQEETLVEARVRLGRVLGLRGRHDAALIQLRRALEQPLDIWLEYFAHLFLATSLEATGDAAGAREAFRRAATVGDGPRVPHLELARLARLAGDIEEMQASLARAMAVPLEGTIEPWWRYRGAQGREASAWIDRVRSAWREGVP